MATSLIKFAGILGSNTVVGMAQKLGLSRPPPRISVRDLFDLAQRTILPFAPVDLQPVNGAIGVSNTPDIFFRDPMTDTPVAAAQFGYRVTQNNVAIDPGHQLSGLQALFSHGPRSAPPGLKWISPLPPGPVTLEVFGLNKARQPGATSRSTFTVAGSLPIPHPPQPTTGTLTIRVGINLGAQRQSITQAPFIITGPGAPTTPVPGQLGPGALSAQIVVPLPNPPQGQSSVLYTLFSTVAFHFEGLINPNSGTISGAEDAQVDLDLATSIVWTGQNRVAQYVITFDGFNNVFLMKLAFLQ